MEALSFPAFRLDKPVEVNGYDFFGRPAQVALLPHDLQGVWVDFGKDEPELVTPERLHINRRSLDFVYGAFTIPIIEHLLALRWWVDGFVIRTRNGGLPYDGSSRTFLQALNRPGTVVEEGVLKPLYLPSGGLTVTDEMQSFVHASSTRGDAGLRVKVGITYPQRFGATKQHRIDGTKEIVFDSSHFPDIATARSLGYPPLLRSVSALAACFGWPHHHHLLWPRWRAEGSELEAAVSEVLNHRILDLLGCLASAIPPGHYPVGTITSFKAGHKLDLQLPKQLWGQLAPADCRLDIPARMP